MNSELILNYTIPAAFAIIGTLVGGAITYVITNKLIKEENKRFLIRGIQDIKINDLNRLYGLVVECTDNINLYGNIGLLDYNEFKNKIQTNINEYELLKQKCELWCDPETIKLFNKIMATLRMLAHKLAKSTIYSKKEPNNIFELEEWKKLTNLKEEMKIAMYRLPEFKIYSQFIK